MTLKIAFQMDPLAGLNIAGDSTFALMLAAQARGYQSYQYAASALNYADGRVWAKAQPVHPLQPALRGGFQIAPVQF